MNEELVELRVDVDGLRQGLVSVRQEVVDLRADLSELETSTIAGFSGVRAAIDDVRAELGLKPRPHETSRPRRQRVTQRSVTYPIGLLRSPSR